MGGRQGKGKGKGVGRVKRRRWDWERRKRKGKEMEGKKGKWWLSGYSQDIVSGGAADTISWLRHWANGRISVMFISGSNLTTCHGHVYSCCYRL